MLPGDVRFALVIRDFQDELATPHGSAIVSALGRTTLSRTRDAWSRVAEALGIAEDDLAERVFGGSVVLAFSDRAAGQGGTPWLVAAESDAAFASLVRRKLSAAPRNVVGGAQVLSIDEGAFVLATIEGHWSEAAGGPRRPDARLLLIGPGDAPGLMLDALRRLGGLVGAAGEPGSLDERAFAVGTLGAQPGFGVAAPEAGSDVVVLWRDRADEMAVVGLRNVAGASGSGWRGSAAFVEPSSSDDSTDGEVSVPIAVREGALADLAEGAFGAVYALMESGARPTGLGWLDGLLEGLPDPLPAALRGAGRSSMLVRVGPTESGNGFEMLAAGPVLNGDPAEAADSVADAVMRSFTGDGVGFGGAFPMARRSALVKPSESSELGCVFEDGAELRWKGVSWSPDVSRQTFVSSMPTRFAVQAGRSFGGVAGNSSPSEPWEFSTPYPTGQRASPTGACGWWTLSMTPAGRAGPRGKAWSGLVSVAEMRPVCSELERPGEGERFVESMGVLHPARMLRALTGSGLAPEPFGLIERLSWWVSPPDISVGEGALAVRRGSFEVLIGTSSPVPETE